MIKNIIFDLGNVIINYDPKQIITYFTDKEDEMRYLYEEIFKSPEWTLMNLGEFTIEESIVAINKRNHFTYDKLTQVFLKEWHKKQPINIDVVELAKKLKKSGYGLFVLSNMANSTFQYFKDNEFFSLCSGIVISAQVHLRKPDERIYRFLLEKYHLNPEECLFIDDDDTGKNYETANKIGIQGRRIVPNQLEDIINLLSEYDVRF